MNADISDYIGTVICVILVVTLFGVGCKGWNSCKTCGGRASINEGSLGMSIRS